jgi:protein gp37
MSDLFHEDVPIEFIAQVFDTMACATVECGKRHKHEEECWTGDPHTFQILTKRPERMREVILTELSHYSANYMRGDCALSISFEVERWPLPNVHLGISAENQEMLDKRWRHLRDTPAAVRFLSLEPLLAPIDIVAPVGAANLDADELHEDGNPIDPDHVIVGGESGSGARPCNVEWIRSIAEQCKEAGVPVFVKQLGSVPVIPRAVGDSVYERGQDAIRRDGEWPEGTHFGNRTGDPALNGMIALLKHPKGGDPAEWPEDLRVREMPT